MWQQGTRWEIRKRSSLLSQQSRGRHLLNIAHTTQQLDAVKCALSRTLSRVQNGASTVLGADNALLINLPGRGVGIGPRRLQLGVHVGKLALDQLVVSNRGTKLLALVGEGQGNVERGLHDAQGPGREDQALQVEALHEDAHAAVDAAHDVVLGDEDVVKHELSRVAAAHAHLVQLPGAAEPVRLGLDQEGRDALGPLVGLRFGVDDDQVGVGPVGYPHLGAVEEIAAVDLLGRCAHAHDVAAGAGLGHGQRANLGAGNQAGEVLLLLLRAAVELQLVHAELRVRRVAQPNGP